MKYFNFLLFGDTFSIPEFFLFMIGFGIFASIVFFLISSGAEKSKKVAENIKENIKKKKLDKKINEDIQVNIREYQKLKNNFQFFSNDKLLNIYKQIKDGNESSKIEQLALEEELVRRKLITHSPMHEKLYGISKGFLKK